MADPRGGGVPVPSGFFVLRTSLLPFDELLRWSRDTAAATNGGESVPTDAELERDRALLRERLREIIARPAVNEALFLASPDLHEHIDAWRREPRDKRGGRVERALVRYLSRMASRPTPFGLFAGCSLGWIRERCSLRTDGASRHARHSRLDMDYLCNLVQRIERRPDARHSLTFFPNSGLHRLADRFRLAEARADNGVRSFHLVSVEATDYLESCLRRAAPGTTPEVLAQGLVADDSEIELDDARAFVDELIDSQILVSDLTPAVTGDEPIHGLIEACRRHDATRAEADCLAGVERELAALDKAGVGAEPRLYRRIAERLSRLEAPVEPSRLFQVDLIKPAAELTIGPPVLQEAQRAVRVLHRVTHPHAPENLARFRAAFNRRFEGRTVPLVEALDNELGVGFDASDRPSAEAAPLLSGLQLPLPEPLSSVAWEPFQMLLLDKLAGAWAAGEREIELHEKELEGIWTQESPPLPPAFDLGVTLAAASSEAVEAGDFELLVHGGTGPSGVRFLGRFCHGDRRLHAEVVRHLRAEERVARGDVVFAEVVHLPDDRLGNVLLRPVLRDYEIPYLGRSGAPAERQIPVTDLTVSVNGQRVVLRSKRLGREIVPRLTTAHNYVARGLPIYRFLCALQGQDSVSGFGWHWGPFEKAAYLPRVRCGRLVLHRAMWNLRRKEIEALKRGGHRAALALRDEKRMPRFVYLVEGDNQLLLDFANPLSVDMFIKLVQHRFGIALVEMYPSHEALCAQSPEGRFTHEMIIPFLRSEPRDHAAEAAPTLPRRRAVEPIRRAFPPGSEWLYARLHCGPAMADHVLRAIVGPLVRAGTASGALDRWFFIRYRDPDWHLRLRLHGSPARLLGELLPEVTRRCEPLLADGRLATLRLDTYERELGRYGGPRGMPLAEELFEADSEALLALLDRIAGDAGADLRWRVALLGMHELLGDFGFDAAGRLRVVADCRRSFGSEFRVDKPTRIRLGDRFRKERPQLQALLRPVEGEGRELQAVREVLRRRSARIAPIAESLRNEERRGGLPGVSLEQLAGSFLHMTANRFLRSAQRAQELVLYEFLERLLRESEARMRQRGSRAEARAAGGRARRVAPRLVKAVRHPGHAP